MTHNFSVRFKLVLFILRINWSHESPNFEIFKCYGEHLPYSLCHFPNNKSGFLQILHHPSVSWKITPLYFFMSNSKDSAQYKQIRVHVLETFKRSGRVPPNSCHLWNKISVFLQIVHQSSGPLDITLLYLLAKVLHTLRSLSKYKFGEVLREQLKLCTLMCSFCPNHVQFHLKMYRGVISHDTEQWSKV